eukprot:6238290-Prorocentrum_lima.AAC.1
MFRGRVRTLVYKINFTKTAVVVSGQQVKQEWQRSGQRIECKNSVRPLGLDAKETRQRGVGAQVARG